MPDYDYDLIVIGSGPAGQRAAIQGAKLDKRVALIERKSSSWRSQRQHGHHPQQDISGSGSRPIRISRARVLRRLLHCQAEHYDRRPAAADRSGDSSRDRRHAPPAHPQPGGSDLCNCVLRRCAHTEDWTWWTVAANGWSPRKMIVIATEPRRRWIRTFRSIGRRIITSDDILRLDCLPGPLRWLARASSDASTPACSRRWAFG